MFRVLSLSQLGLTATQSEQIELALSYGFRGLDLDVVEFHDRVQAHGLSHARRLLDSAKIKLGSFQLPFDPAADEEVFKRGLDQLKPWAELAATVGCLRAVTIVAPTSAQRPYHENFEFHRKRYNEVATVLAPFGIRLGIGFSAVPSKNSEQSFEFIRTFDALVLLVGTVASRNVGILADVWQLWRSGGRIEDLRKLAPQQLVAVRICNAPADQLPEATDESARLLPGTAGAIDASAVLGLLAEIGYDGPITPNPARQQFENLNREAIVKTVAQDLEKAWKSANLTTAGKFAAPAKK